MKPRTTFLTLLLLLAAGAALAAPTTGETLERDTPPILGSDLEEATTLTDHGISAPTLVEAQEPTALAIFDPCGCTPNPGCQDPFWPTTGPTFPFPDPIIISIIGDGHCGPCPL